MCHHHRCNCFLNLDDVNGAIAVGFRLGWLEAGTSIEVRCGAVVVRKDAISDYVNLYNCFDCV